MKLILVLILPLFSYALSPAKSLYFKQACNSCHGMYGEGTGTIPRLQGQKEAVLLSRLKDLQKGKTRTSDGVIMISFARSLTAVQTKQMAKYLASLKTEIPEERYELEFDNAGDGGS